METTYIGIDIAKATFDVVVRRGSQNSKPKTFDNTPKGIAALQKWLPHQPWETMWVCLEATGTYGEAVAEALLAKGCQVSVVNPLRTKRFAEAGLVRNQTDAVDARLIAEFCEAVRPRLWTPPSPAQKALRALSRRLEELDKMRRMEQNRLQAHPHLPEEVQASLRATLQLFSEQIASIKRQLSQMIRQDPELERQKKLLKSIQGVGELTAVRFLAELGDLRNFHNAKQLAAYLGLTPEYKISGTSVLTKPKLSKKGPAQVRHLLYFPAIVAMSHNPIVRTFCNRLSATHSVKMVLVAAAMHKLVHLMYGVVHTGLPFDPNYLASGQVAS